MPTDDQQALVTLLRSLRSGKSKVLLTSRSDERWLGGPEVCTRMPLDGLNGEERWVFCQLIVDDLGLVVNREDADQVALMKKLGGHPLLMRAVLPKLESMTAGAIVNAVEKNLAAVVDAEDELGAKVMATLEFVAQSLPQKLAGLLVPMSLHEHFVMSDDLEAMAEEVPGTPGEWSRPRIDALLEALTIAGLVTRCGPKLFELHPALTTYLRGRVAGDARDEAWQRGFVDRIGKVADHLTPQELHQQRPAFAVHGANFRHALALALTLGMNIHVAALTQSLASWALRTRDFAGARALFEALAQYAVREGNSELEASAYHQLGMVAEEQRDFDAAERWSRKALAIKEKQGDEHGAATSYGQLGNVAQKQQDFEAAERWYRKSLAIKEKQDDEHGAATSYGQLGTLVGSRGDLEAAASLFIQAAKLFAKTQAPHEFGMTSHNILRCHDLAADDIKPTIRQAWEAAGFSWPTA